jgi:hypothetical protein
MREPLVEKTNSGDKKSVAAKRRRNSAFENMQEPLIEKTNGGKQVIILVPATKQSM